jgi:hypothetical protein
MRPWVQTPVSHSFSYWWIFSVEMKFCSYLSCTKFGSPVWIPRYHIHDNTHAKIFIGRWSSVVQYTECLSVPGALDSSKWKQNPSSTKLPLWRKLSLSMSQMWMWADHSYSLSIWKGPHR